jgi:hypothetical protein
MCITILEAEFLDEIQTKVLRIVLLLPLTLPLP